MWTTALALLPLLWRERSYFLGLIAKYSAIPSAASSVDGEALIAIIKRYEPLVYEVVKAGFSISKAIAVVFARTFTPHKMTREEEEEWLKRASGDGQF